MSNRNTVMHMFAHGGILCQWQDTVGSPEVAQLKLQRHILAPFSGSRGHVPPFYTDTGGGETVAWMAVKYTHVDVTVQIPCIIFRCIRLIPSNWTCQGTPCGIYLHSSACAQTDKTNNWKDAFKSFQILALLSNKIYKGLCNLSVSK